MISVSIVSTAVQVSPPGWHLEYEVRNAGSAEIWLVVGESPALRQEGRRIELSYARKPLQPGVQAFGYFDPEVIRVAPGSAVRRSVDLQWPLRLSDLWNARKEAAPEPGEYEVSIRIGFGLTPAPDDPQLGEPIEASVLRWQQEAVSPPVRIAIPRDDAAPEPGASP